ncbi:hypothetical protein REPUB_Repub20aG0091400 [Reevesia pubescens]
MVLRLEKTGYLGLPINFIVRKILFLLLIWGCWWRTKLGIERCGIQLLRNSDPN